MKGLLPFPFVLFHKSGVTGKLHRFIISHANAGLTTREIQTLWLQTMYDAYGSRREAYISECNKNSNICSSFIIIIMIIIMNKFILRNYQCKNFQLRITMVKKIKTKNLQLTSNRKV